jgi:hypothetical protein
LATGNTVETVIGRFLGAGYLNTGLTAISTILWNDALPTVKPPNIDTYITANPTNDYVIEDTAMWNYLVIALAASIADPPADPSLISFKDLADMLKVKLRVYWYIDSDGFVRFEHEKYFNDFASQLDITTLNYKQEVDKRIYNYEKSDIYSQVLYSESGEGNEDWIAFPINYDLIKTTPNVLSLSPPSLTTDKDNIFANPSSASGFILLECTSNDSGVVSESTLTPGDFYTNAHLAWSWLIENYYSYFGEADEAEINDGGALTLDSVKRFKKQTGIKFYYDGILTWIRPVTLLGGKAWIDKMELDLSSGWYIIDVGFDPY